MTSETETVDQQASYRMIFDRFRHYIERAFRVEVLDIDRRMDDPFNDGLDSRDRLDGTGGSQGVSNHRLR